VYPSVPLILSKKTQPRVVIHLPPANNLSAARYFPSIKHSHDNIHQNFPVITFTENDSSLGCLSNTLVPPATTVPLDFTSCYYQSSFYFTSIWQIFQYFLSRQATPLGGRLSLYLRYFLVDPCPIVHACVYLSMSVYNFFSTCLEASTKFYHNAVKSNLPPNLLTCQFKMATRSCSCSHVIPSHRP